ncbi:U6 snRNA phosphodiesterase Usb1 [Chaetomium fimeti]|uniref:U6 snRNA phosphodiesterase n=1 Tax=Chaetomium fimeti TaxID=1854472 RepID=A0AAE0LWJ2_9PEZI|nr:U6 snRNA phosphodiesterase Usb1 [Chaetomium fimeti]
MALVDYASDSDTTSTSSTDTRNRKKQKTTPPSPTPPSSLPNNPPKASTTTPLPPLPPAFHDLYAATTRTTTHDDPALHQGRARQTPHTPGSWPSHVYVEWHPPPATHALLTTLVTTLQTTLQTNPQTALATKGGEGVEVVSFLTSELATPLPLHVSLTRPVVVGTGEKEGFLREVAGAVVGGGGGGPGGQGVFGLRGSGVVEWHRTGESGRSFLVLRVCGLRGRGQRNGEGLGGGGDEDGDGENPNPELTGLLRRCNAVVARYGQPGLYEWAEDEGADGGRRVGEAFHVSIAWSFAEPTEELVRATEQVFGGRDTQQKLREVQIPVESIKVKIGNVVTNVALRQPGVRPSGEGAKNLLGL